MKSRVCFSPLSVSLQPGHRFPSFSPVVVTRARRQRRLLLGMSIALILCWMIGAIWLIDVRRSERSTAEVLAQQGAIAAILSTEMVNSR